MRRRLTPPGDQLQHRRSAAEKRVAAALDELGAAQAEHTAASAAINDFRNAEAARLAKRHAINDAQRDRQREKRLNSVTADRAAGSAEPAAREVVAAEVDGRRALRPTAGGGRLVSPNDRVVLPTIPISPSLRPVPVAPRAPGPTAGEFRAEKPLPISSSLRQGGTAQADIILPSAAHQAEA